MFLTWITRSVVKPVISAKGKRGRVGEIAATVNKVIYLPSHPTRGLKQAAGLPRDPENLQLAPSDAGLESSNSSPASTYALPRVGPRLYVDHLFENNLVSGGDHTKNSLLKVIASPLANQMFHGSQFT
jgi:hypothetical protein